MSEPRPSYWTGKETPYAPIPNAGRRMTTGSPESGVSTADNTSDLEQQIGNYRPDNEMQALMECAPGVEPEWSKERLQPLGELLLDALEMLTEEEQWIINAVIYERKSVRAVAAEIGTSKTRVDRMKHNALRKLESYLQDVPEIKERLTR